MEEAHHKTHKTGGMHAMAQCVHPKIIGKIHELVEAAISRLESIMLQNLLIMLFGISPIFCLLCSFLCFLGMHLC